MTLSLVEAQARSADIEQVSYSVHLDLVDPLRFVSETTVRFRSRSGRTFLELAGARDVSATLDGLRIESLAYDGARLVLVDLTPGVQHEVTVTATLPYVTDGEGMHTFTDPVDGERYVGAYLGVDLTQRVFACFDQPDVKAPISLTVRGEGGWTVLANGRLLDVYEDVWRFATTRPLPCNQFVVCAGPWASRLWTAEGRQFGWHARQSLASDLERELAELRGVTASCFAHYGKLFTAPYEFGSYHQIFVPGQNWGAQETPGCVMYADELLSETVDDSARQERAVTIAHEMAHMWFGNLATMRWYQDIWLNESFADYLGCRVAGEAAGYPSARVDFEVLRKPSGYVADRRRSSHPVAATSDDVPDSTAAASNFDAISYFKGHAVIRQLAAWLGDEQFFAGVNAYLHDFSFANAGLDDFIGRLSAAAPRQDVVGWAQSWLRTTGFDDIDVIDTATDPAVRSTGLRPHLISVAAYDESLQLLEVRRLTVGEQPVVLPGWRDRIILPNAHGETFARVRLRQHDDEMLCRHVARVADPLQRAQIWSNTFARLHARELSPLEYFEVVETQLPEETQASIVRAVIRQTLRRGVQVCGSASEVTRGFAAVASACDARLRRSTDQKDAATAAWVDGLVRSTATSTDLHRWHRQGDVEGVPLSVEQHWVLIWRMAEIGSATTDLILSNLSADEPAQVWDWAERAKAAVPDAHAGRMAWAQVEDEKVSNRRVCAVLDGLWSAGRGSVPDEQVLTYLTQAPRLALRRGPGFAALLGSLHPGLALTPDQLRTLTAALEGTLEPRLRRQWQDWYDDLTVAP